MISNIPIASYKEKLSKQVQRSLMIVEEDSYFKTDQGLKNTQDLLAAISLFPSNRLSRFAAGAAALVAAGRDKLDELGIVQTTSGDTETQKNILVGRALTRATNLDPNLRSMLPFALMSGGQTVPVALLGGMISGQIEAQAKDPERGKDTKGPTVSKEVVVGMRKAQPASTIRKRLGKIGGMAAVLPVLAASEWVRDAAGPLSQILGLPPIPGLDRTLTSKDPYGTELTYTLKRGYGTPTALELIAAANATKN